MNLWFDVVTTPLGPPFVLFLGALILAGAGRWMRRPLHQRGTALFFVAAAGLLQLYLRNRPVVPEFSRPWQPVLQQGTNLLWIGDGWNWYVASLMLLLGSAGVLLYDYNRGDQATTTAQSRLTGANLALHLGMLASGLLFVSSGNLLTATLTWVLMDGLQLARYTFVLHRPPQNLANGHENGHENWAEGRINRAQGLSLIGALLLLIGLLPAGPGGPGQPLQGGVLPMETVALMLVAAAIRAGAYPFHLWLLPSSTVRMSVSERLLDHMVPALGGLWLLAWAIDLGNEFILVHPAVLTLILLGLLASAVAAWTVTDQPGHTSFVLVTSVGLAGLAGALSPLEGPNAMIWPTTAFALGGALWLVGERVWQEWGWQIPVSLGRVGPDRRPLYPRLSHPALFGQIDHVELADPALFLDLHCGPNPASGRPLAQLGHSAPHGCPLPALQPGDGAVGG